MINFQPGARRDHFSDVLSVLVTGCTGLQGGAVARALLLRGHDVRGMTRNPESASAIRLSELGAEIWEADFEDPMGVEAAMEGVDAVFTMGTPYESGPDAERRQGRTLIDAARSARVGHVVMSSVAGADLGTGVPHFDSKHDLERYLRAADVPHTVVAPTFFMENLSSPWMRADLSHGILRMALPRRRPLQLVAADDLGTFVARVFERRTRHLGRRIEICSDEVSPDEIARILSHAIRTSIVYDEVPMERLQAEDPDTAAMFRWLTEIGFQVDISALHRRYDDMEWTSLTEWASTQDWGRLRPPSQRRPRPQR